MWDLVGCDPLTWGTYQVGKPTLSEGDPLDPGDDKVQSLFVPELALGLGQLTHYIDGSIGLVASYTYAELVKSRLATQCGNDTLDTVVSIRGAAQPTVKRLGTV